MPLFLQCSSNIFKSQTIYILFVIVVNIYDVLRYDSIFYVSN